ncbi:MAG: ferrous iron transport protein, partial [Candidatus Hydrogenedentes bacterium]|nr:ferrous iron transport protein [Candidatus Hydrogenedentota bacterium]
PGIIATRMLESRRERLIAATLVTIAVPCASLQAMIWGLLGARGPQYVALVYLILFAVWIVLGRILDGLLKGSSPELILEIPAYRIPSWQTVFQKLALRMRSFFREAAPIVLVGILAVNVLYFFGLFDALADFTAPVVTKLFGLPKQAVIALVIGFLRKDVAIGMLGTLDLTANQLVVSVVILSMSFPCVATFSILLKELGPRGFAFSLTIMLASATIVGTLLNLIL